MLGIDEETVLSSVTNTRYNNFLQLVKGNTKIPLYFCYVGLKIKAFKFSLLSRSKPLS